MTAADIISRLHDVRERRAPIGYDVEGSTWISCQSFAESPTRAFCIVTDALGEHAGAVWAAVTAVLEDEAVPKVVWNAHHELTVLKGAHGITLRSWEDGMALWFERWPELPKGLKFAASILTRRPCWTEGIEFDEDDGQVSGRGEALYHYNMHDSAATIELWHHPVLVAARQDPVISARYALRKRLIEALTWASLKGLSWDRAEADRIRGELTPRLWAAQAEVDRIAGVELPVGEASLLAAAARRWCHAVKLHKFAGFERVKPTP